MSKTPKVRKLKRFNAFINFMDMEKGFGLLIVLTHLFTSSYPQDVPLFRTKQPINLTITGSIKAIKNKTNDSTLVTGKFEYEQGDGQWIPVPVQSRVRGNFRLRYCYFPPLKLKFKKNQVDSTLFEGNKALKLVLPCRTSSDKDNLVRREYLCYQFYEVLSPYYFRTRLANIALTEISKKKPRTYELLSFFVEDNSMVAERSQGKIIETKGISPALFDEKQSIRNDFFQYMIGNADWSAVFQHNSNTMKVQGKYVPLSYDFDMSGFVNADYAHENAPSLGTGDPRERVYRGFCKSTAAMNEIRKEFLDKESAIYAILEEHAASFSKYELNDMQHYLNEFFEILKSDNRFKDSILNLCRTK